jgi:Histidine phosphatase superfamily (branch 1)
MKFRFCSAFIVHSVFLLLCPLCTAQQSVRHIFLIRHAERLSALPVSPLSPAGQARAECLAQTLKDSGITQIFVSEIKATQETAAPLASVIGVKPSSIAARDTSALVRNLTYGAAGNALVIAEGDTLPVIIARLQGGTVKISPNVYDSLFELTIVEGGGTPAAVLHYCSAGTPPAPVQQRTPGRPMTRKPLAKKP